MTKERKAGITIVIATLNVEAKIASALESIKNQRNAIINLIIIDGGSTDKTVEIINSFGSMVDILIVGEDCGIYDAWNKAIPHSKSKWMFFMGADDYLAHPYAVAQATHFLNELNDGPIIAYGRVIQHGNGIAPRIRGEPWKRIAHRRMSEMPLPHQGVFHLTSFLQEAKFDTSYRVAADYKIFLLSLRYQEPVFIDSLIFCYQSAGGISGQRSNRKMILDEFLRARKEVGMETAKTFWWIYVKALCWLFFASRKNHDQ